MNALRGIVGTILELGHYLWKSRLWWLVPMVVALLLCTAVIVLAAVAPGTAPFIYSLF